MSKPQLPYTVFLPDGTTLEGQCDSVQPQHGLVHLSRGDGSVLITGQPLLAQTLFVSSWPDSEKYELVFHAPGHQPRHFFGATQRVIYGDTILGFSHEGNQYWASTSCVRIVGCKLPTY